MNTDLSAEAVEYGTTVRRVLEAAGGDALSTAPSAGAAVDSADAADAAAKVLGDVGAWDLDPRGTVEELEAASLDGVQAIGVRHETVSDAGRPIVQIGYLTLRDGQVYSIVLSVPVQSESASQPALDAVLASWTWDEGQPATGEPAASTA
jgi:hypothetical protein